MSTIGDPFEVVFDLLQYDHCEDDDGVLGNWKFSREGDTITISYLPYPDGQSPYTPVTASYKVSRLTFKGEGL